MPADGKEQGQSQKELLLIRLAYKEGRLVDAGANRPITLDGDDAWIVFAGKLDIFAVEYEGGRPAGSRRHVYRVEAGGAAFGLGRAPQPIGLLAVGVAGTRLIRISQARLFALGAQEAFVGEIAPFVDGWVAALGWGATRGLPPKSCTLLEAGTEVAVDEAAPMRSARGVVWADVEHGGELSLVDAAVPVAPGGPFPVSDRTWLWSARPAAVRVAATATVLESSAAGDGLRRFHDAVAAWLEIGYRRHGEEEQGRMARRSSWHHRVLAGGAERLASVLSPERALRSGDAEAADAAVLAFRAVAEAQGISASRLPATVEGEGPRERAVAAARAADVRMRQVVLRGRWWGDDNGPLLAFGAGDGRPLALVPRASGRYEVYDPAGGTRARLGRRAARSIEPLAYHLYRPFPRGPVGGRELLAFGLRGSAPDLARLALLGLAGGLLAMVAPLVARALFDTVITGSHREMVVHLTALLLLAAVAAAALQVTWSIAVVRVSSRMELMTQAAVWDRLLELPVSFFRRYAVGDLAARANAVMAIRQLLSETALTALLAFLFCLPNVALLFYFDWRLALIALAFLVVASAGALLTFAYQLALQRRLHDLLGAISGKLLQFLSAIGKLHSTATEARVFAVWADDFATQKELAVGSRRAGMPLTVFNAVLPLLVTTVFFGFVAFFRLGDISTGSFVAFLVAFAAVLAPGLQMCGSVGAALGAVPMYERLRPVLEAAPETQGERADPGELRGAIELAHVSFSYDPDGPLVLDDVSLQIEPGQQIAIVGPSGSGKSTLFRLLTGFEAPTSGSVYFDGKELSGLDVRAVRRQMGVVLQHGQLMVGDIFQNIVGAATMPVEAAWEAARMAGIDEDIRQMPMQMHTFVCEGASTFAGGQRQRLLVARALVTRPRIVLFDEATSALDNVTQAIVSRSISELNATRVVIAHRLSTIASADRIYVLDRGRIVQAGTHEELSSQPGLFASLIQRQLV